MDTNLNWHTLEAASTVAQLDSSTENGLSTEQVVQRVSEYGVNELVERGERTLFQILWKQLTSILVLILIGAAILADLLGDPKNTIAIIAVVVLYTLLGLIQEYRAEKVIDALRKISIPNVRVLRDRNSKEIPARELVPGDILQIETGNVIPADVRLLEAVNLRIQDAALSGESEAVEKHTADLSGDELPIRDRRNMAYMGTIVTQGRGLAIVVATGMKTELGKIADLIQNVKQEENPLQHKLDSLGRSLAWIGLVISVIIFILGLLRGNQLHHALLTAVSVAIAIVPEALPIVVIVTLALGAERMFQREIFVRKLPAVETLGSVSVICSDKTGTLTENRMTVVVLDVAEHALDLTEEMNRGGSLRTTRGLGAPVQSSLSLAAIGGALCNDAQLMDEGDDRFHTLGDSTEGSLVVAAAKMGYWKSALDASFPRAAEHPFDSERKRMTTVHHLGQYDPSVLSGLEVGDHRYIAFTKGNVDSLLDLTSHIWVEGKSLPLDESWRSRIEAANERLLKKGMRALGIGFRLLDAIPEIIQTDLEQGLTLVGLFGMVDPPRIEVQKAVAECRVAGIRPVMITSDHPLTAIEVARQLGITQNGRALRGAEIEELSPNELKNVIDEVNVFARVAPQQKLKIVQALQAKGHVVAITGDGLNDAPALRKADIGVAMGIGGTEVAREASDIILFDDNFATVVNGVKEGRTISANIARFMHFSVIGNIGKALVMLIAPFLQKPLALLPLQLLWLNLIVDGLLGFGMGVEKPAEDAMKRTPASRDENIFSRQSITQTIWMGALIGGLAIALGAWYYFNNRSEWQTMIFASLGFMQIFHALASRSQTKSFFKMGIMSNPLLIGMAMLALLLQLGILYIPIFSRFFEFTPLHGHDLAIAVLAGLFVFVVFELRKDSPFNPQP